MTKKQKTKIIKSEIGYDHILYRTGVNGLGSALIPNVEYWNSQNFNEEDVIVSRMDNDRERIFVYSERLLNESILNHDKFAHPGTSVHISEIQIKRNKGEYDFEMPINNLKHISINNLDLLKEGLIRIAFTNKIADEKKLLFLPIYNSRFERNDKRYDYAIKKDWLMENFGNIIWKNSAKRD